MERVHRNRNDLERIKRHCYNLLHTQDAVREVADYFLSLTTVCSLVLLPFLDFIMKSKGVFESTDHSDENG